MSPLAVALSVAIWLLIVLAIARVLRIMSRDAGDDEAALYAEIREAMDDVGYQVQPPRLGLPDEGPSPRRGGATSSAVGDRPELRTES